MIIGYDAKRAVANMTGLGNYSRLVIEETATLYPSDKLLLYTPKLTASMRVNPRLAAINELPNTEYRFPYGLGPMSSGSLWRSLGITRHFRADGLSVYHGLSNELPLNIDEAMIPSVVTVHDLIYRRLPYCYSAPDRIIYNIKYGHSARRSTRVIAISECTKRDLVELQHVDPDKIDVIYQGCDDQFRCQLTDSEKGDALAKYGIEGRYLLQVGTIERRKNLEISVRALSALPDDMKLVAVGRDNNYLPYVKDLARRLGVFHRLVVLPKVEFKDLPALNQGATAILYPSRYEGFGIPVIEGLESRRPVVAATGSCLEEAGGEAAWYVNPDDPAGLARLLDTIIRNESELIGRIEAGIRQASRFDTSRMASHIMDTYLHAIEDYRRAHPGWKPYTRKSSLPKLMQ